MVALPDTHMPETPLKMMNGPMVTDEADAANPLKRAMMAGLGASAVIAALGVWIVPVDDGDTAMQLVKLVFSVKLLVLGMLFISALDNRNADPEIHLDPTERMLKIVAYDTNGAAHVMGRYKLDDLSDITLRDRHLSARDPAGAQIVSVPVPSAGAEKAIRAVLNEIA